METLRQAAALVGPAAAEMIGRERDVLGSLIGKNRRLELAQKRGRRRQFLLYIQIQSRSMPLPAPDVKDCVLGSWSAAHQLLP